MKTCLIVDDSRVIRKVSRRILEDLGFEVAEASNGVEAMAWCDAVMPDVILLDWAMPEMDGLTFVRQLRSETGIERIREALDAGADEYIMKPFDGAIVAGKLRSLDLLQAIAA